MSSINNVGGNSPVSRIVANPIHREVQTETAKPMRASDRLELSGASHLLKSLKTNDMRMDKVASIKAQIESGGYEADHKLDAAVDRLLDDLTK